MLPPDLRDAMADYADIKLTISDGLACIAVCRTRQLNAYRDQTADELLAAIKRCDADPSVRAVMLTGEGRAFGAGYDLSTISPDDVPALDDVLENHFNPVIRAMRASRLPFVAAVNGPCAGASVGIALACDIVVAARSAYFYEPFVGIALVPDAGNTAFLTYAMGRGKASAMMLLGEKVSADRASEWGLIWKVVDDAQLEAECRSICDILVSRDPDAVASTKRLIEASHHLNLDEQLDMERDLQGELGRAPAMKAQIAAFFARKKAK